MFKRFLFAAALISAFGSCSAMAQRAAALEGNVVIITPCTLTANQAMAFEEFVSDGRYNGAFYVSQNGGFSWRSNLNTLDAAKVLANQRCNETGRNCQIYATLVPKKPRIGQVIEGLSMTAARDAEVWARANATQGRKVAIAASQYAGWAGWQGNRSHDRIKSSALNHCGDLLRPRIERLKAPQKDALEREGLLNCQIIFTQPAR